MEKVYYRVSYNGIGIYDALKKQLWVLCLDPKSEWDRIKKSSSFNWLKTPNIYSDNYRSYFTELGFDYFKEKTLPVIYNYLDKENILIEKFVFDDLKLEMVYSDLYQIVIAK